MFTCQYVQGVFEQNYKMIKSEIHTPKKEEKNNLHQMTALTSEYSRSGSFKIYRKRESSSRKKSKNSSSKQSKTNSMKSFYIKNIYDSRFSIVDDPEARSKEEKKREPTPVKSKKLLPKYKDEKNGLNEHLKMLQIQNKLKITDLEKKNIEKNQMLEKLKRRVKASDEKVEDLTRLKEENRRQIKELAKQNKEKTIKIEELEKSILQRQTNLSEAQNSLERLKKTIKENRIAELKRVNQSLLENLQQANKKIFQVQRKLEEREAQLQILRKENKNLNNRVRIEKSCRTESMKEKYFQRELKKLRDEKEKGRSQEEKLMEEKVKELTEANFYLHSEIKQYGIKMNLVQRKNLEEFRKYTKAKNEEFNLQKQKYKKLLNKYDEKKKQIADYEMKIKQTSRFLNPPSSRKSSVSLSLSPQ